MSDDYCNVQEEIDFDIDPEEYLDSKTLKVDGNGQPLPGSLEEGLQDGKKEEINYDWAQVTIINCVDCFIYIQSGPLTLFMLFFYIRLG